MELRLWGLGFRAESWEAREVVGFGVQGLGLRVGRLGSLGFKIQGLGLRF
jgi:hypothetical protein